MAKQEPKSNELTLAVEAPALRTGRYVPRRVDMKLPTGCAQNMRDIFDGLYARKAKLKNGREVEKPQHALLWLLENLAPAQGSQTQSKK